MHVTYNGGHACSGELYMSLPGTQVRPPKQSLSRLAMSQGSTDVSS